MYHAFFGLRQAPFDPVADAAFLVETAGQRGALDAIADLVRRRAAVITLEGWPGSGKTELLRAYDRGIDPDRVRTRWLTRHDFDRPGLLAILGEMLVGPFATAPSFQEGRELLLARANAGQATVLLVDDAENLTDSALQALGSITDLARDELSLVSVVLVVRPPFVELFSRPAAAALDRRASVRVRLPLLTPIEARGLVEHRLRAAGADDPHQVLSPEALEAIVIEAGGIPRRLLSLGDRVLQAGFARRRQPVDYATAEAAIRNGGPPPAPAPPRVRPPITAEPRGFTAPQRPVVRRSVTRRVGNAIAGMAIPTMLLIVAAGLGYWLWTQSDMTSPRPEIQAAAPPAAPAPAAPPAPAPPAPAPAAPMPAAPAPAVPAAPAPAQAPPQVATAPPHPTAPASPPRAAPAPVNLLFIPARRGETLHSIYRKAYHTPRYRPPFEQMLAANPDLEPEKPLANGQLVALPGPLIDR